MRKTMFAISAAFTLAMLPQTSAAQTVLKADVPTGFHVMNSGMPQGNYRVIIPNSANGPRMLHFANIRTGQQVIALARVSAVNESDSTARLSLRCVDGDWEVASVTVHGNQWTFLTRKLTPEQTKRLFTKAVPLTSSHSAE